MNDVVLRIEVVEAAEKQLQGKPFSAPPDWIRAPEQKSPVLGRSTVEGAQRSGDSIAGALRNFRHMGPVQQAVAVNVRMRPTVGPGIGDNVDVVPQVKQTCDLVEDESFGDDRESIDHDRYLHRVPSIFWGLAGRRGIAARLLQRRTQGADPPPGLRGSAEDM
jgi:hypothetical protein